MVVFAAAGGYLGAAVIARHRAQAAADLAVLGAAGAVTSGPESACLQATEIATRMRATVAECRIDGLDVMLEVAVPVRLGRWGAGPAKASARAGPVEVAG
ncbi:Rv3654c family TadE-like protein [Mycolicibacterium sp. HK-90]|uniref:Rv3654c family TadE-like protein n=1 Tax=Mycolicibacterium sp. HK-90 TaxID=3056937 RepID=UPI0034620191